MKALVYAARGAGVWRIDAFAASHRTAAKLCHCCSPSSLLRSQITPQSSAKRRVAMMGTLPRRSSDACHRMVIGASAARCALAWRLRGAWRTLFLAPAGWGAAGAGSTA